MIKQSEMDKKAAALNCRVFAKCEIYDEPPIQIDRFRFVPRMTWRHTDASGHVHRWVKKGKTTTCPTLKRSTKTVQYPHECDCVKCDLEYDDESVSCFRCKECGAEVIPEYDEVHRTELTERAQSRYVVNICIAGHKAQEVFNPTTGETFDVAPFFPTMTGCAFAEIVTVEHGARASVVIQAIGVDMAGA